ncbi:MAG: TetR/AcrR family transcriptional regulator [Acetatifactor sp.]|nr:TetR/AcrR family transcriptional regulator [Acetatifactor sp.]
MLHTTGKENQRVRLTKTLFKTALIQLLSEKKIHEITIQELCQKAELNRTTFYKHYQNIRDLLDEIENETLERSTLCLEQTKIEKEASVTTPLFHYLCYIRDNSDTYRLLLNPSNDFNRKLLAPATDFLKKQSETLSQLTELTETSLTYYQEYILSGSVALIRNWLFNGTIESPELIASMIYEIAVKLLK